MRYQVKQAGIALQVAAQIRFLVDDPVQVINGFFIITTAKIQAGDLIIKTNTR